MIVTYAASAERRWKMAELIEKASSLLSAADEYKAERLLYEIRMGTDKGRMKDDGSLTRYCGNCIDSALQEKKRSYFLERQRFMGKIYEYQTTGCILEPQYKWGKGGKTTCVILKKRQSKEDKEKVIKHLKMRLKKEFPKSMKFDSDCFDVGSSEYDGFEHCDGCGVIFEQGLILTDQELEHWAEMDICEYADMIKSPYHAYQLQKIIDNWCPGKFADRIIEIAQKILNASELTNPTK